MQDARTSVTPHTSIYIYGNGLIWTWIDENCMYPPWDARLALQISANAIFLLCMESCLLAQLHSSPMQSKAMEHSLPQRVRGRDCHCNESDIGIDIELEIIQDISTDWYQITTYHKYHWCQMRRSVASAQSPAKLWTSLPISVPKRSSNRSLIQHHSAPFSTSSGVPAVMVTWIRMVMMRLKMLKPSESSVKGFLGKDVAWPHPWTCRSQFNGQLLGWRWRWMRWMRWMHLWDASLRWLRNCGKCRNWGSFSCFSWSSFRSQLPSKGWWITLCGLV